MSDRFAGASVRLRTPPQHTRELALARCVFLLWGRVALRLDRWAVVAAPSAPPTMAQPSVSSPLSIARTLLKFGMGSVVVGGEWAGHRCNFVIARLARTRSPLPDT